VFFSEQVHYDSVAADGPPTHGWYAVADDSLDDLHGLDDGSDRACGSAREVKLQVW